MSSTLILPAGTELRALEETLEMVKDFQIISSTDRLPKITKRIFIDLTFDLFIKQNSMESFYRTFADLEVLLQSLEHSDTDIILLKNYPFRSNIRNFLQKQKLLDQYAEIAAEYSGAKVLYVPTLISRKSFQSGQTPPVKIINSLRLEQTESVKVKNSSRYIIIYERDLVDILLQDEREMTNHSVVEGIELSLEDIYNRTQPVVGSAPIYFDSTQFIHYEYPLSVSNSIGALNYDLEDMVLDITTKLF